MSKSCGYSSNTRDVVNSATLFKTAGHRGTHASGDILARRILSLLEPSRVPSK